VSVVERRCPTCGALVAPDAGWCGQCYTDLREREPQAHQERVSTAAGGGPSSERAAPTDEPRPAFWPCPVCGNRNPIDLDACATCGTSFAHVMRDEPHRSPVDAKDAVVWSLVFPGLGHRKVGRPLDGLARGVLFAVSFSLAVLLGLTRVRSGPTLLVFFLFLVTGVLVYLGSAFEAYRLAEGGHELVSSRVLLWVLVVVILVSIVMLALAVVTTSSG
jgi:ribosomal protein L40E